MEHSVAARTRGGKRRRTRPTGGARVIPGPGSARIVSMMTEHTHEERPADREPDWWHRDHPTFTALTGFFTGLVFVIAVPGLFAAILHVVFDDNTAEDMFPFVLVMVGVPIALLVGRRTRRF